MTDSPVRLSPSGPVIGKASSPGPGARIRLTEATSVMGDLERPQWPSRLDDARFAGTCGAISTKLTLPRAAQAKENGHPRLHLGDGVAG